MNSEIGKEDKDTHPINKNNTSNSVITPKKKQKKHLISSLVAAFLEYPLFVEILEDISSRRIKLQVLLKMCVKYGYKFGSIFSTEDCEGVLIFIDTIHHAKETKWRWVLAGALHYIFIWDKEEVKKYEDIMSHIDKSRTKNAPADHIYIMFLGVNPVYHKQGHARQLLNRVILRSEEEHLPLYLETFKPINEVIYKQFGFQTMEKYSIPNSDLILYSMLRSPELESDFT
jgi:GNAT superfamily N-acetyltransferase